MSSPVKPVTSNLAKVKTKKPVFSSFPSLFSEPIQIHKHKKESKSVDHKQKHSTNNNALSHKLHTPSGSIKRNSSLGKSKHPLNEKQHGANKAERKDVSNAVVKDKHLARVIKKEKSELHSHQVKKHEYQQKKKEIHGLVKSSKPNHSSNTLHKSSNNIIDKNHVKSSSKLDDVSNKDKSPGEASAPVYIYSANEDSRSVKVVFNDDKNDNNESDVEKLAHRKDERSHSNASDNVFENLMNLNEENKVVVGNRATDASQIQQSNQTVHNTEEQLLHPAHANGEPLHKATIAFTDKDVIVTDVKPSLSPAANCDSARVADGTSKPDEESSPKLAHIEFDNGLPMYDGSETAIKKFTNADDHIAKLKRKLSDSGEVKHKRKKHKHDREHKRDRNRDPDVRHRHKHKHKKHKREKHEVSDPGFMNNVLLSKVKVENNLSGADETETRTVLIKQEPPSPALSSDEKCLSSDDAISKLPKRVGILELGYSQALSSDVDVVNQFPFSSPRFRTFVHVESDPNGEASVLHAYQHEIADLSTEEQELFAKDFCTLCFQETNHCQADFVMGIVHGAASFMPDYLEYLAEKHPQLRVKSEVLGQRDIITMNVSEFREQVCRTYSKDSGMYRLVVKCLYVF